ncbi:DUF3386 domain-containing protein [Synechocystis sp. LKSZ1]|uniref:DUF3386 domain-containing protein n=1 Tax=Synechocystis sp. LKSZ1 TaxID=3144951 RepID=UPI00336BE856
MTLTLSAQDLFRTAYESRYTWDAQFPGYHADLTLQQGEECYQGQVQISRDLSVMVQGFEDPTVQESIQHQLRDIVTHRQRRSFEQAHSKNQFRFGETDDSGAQAILVQGDAMGSHYKIRGSEICQVSRVMGPMAFTIDTQECLQTEQGYLPIQYHAIFRDAQSQALRGQRHFQDRYENLNGYYLPVYQKIEAIDSAGQTIVTEFIYTNLELLGD